MEEFDRCRVSRITVVWIGLYWIGWDWCWVRSDWRLPNPIFSFECTIKKRPLTNWASLGDTRPPKKTALMYMAISHQNKDVTADCQPTNTHTHTHDGWCKPSWPRAPIVVAPRKNVPIVAMRAPKKDVGLRTLTHPRGQRVTDHMPIEAAFSLVFSHRRQSVTDQRKGAKDCFCVAHPWKANNGRQTMEKVFARRRGRGNFIFRRHI